MKYPNQTIQIKIETIKLVPLDSSIYEAGFWDWYSTENFPLSNTDSVKLREKLNHPYSREREREEEEAARPLFGSWEKRIYASFSFLSSITIIFLNRKLREKEKLFK